MLRRARVGHRRGEVVTERRIVGPVVFGLLATLGTALAQPTDAVVRLEADPVPVAPNVVVILLDDARLDDLTTMPDVRARIGGVDTEVAARADLRAAWSPDTASGPPRRAPEAPR